MLIFITPFVAFAVSIFGFVSFFEKNDYIYLRDNLGMLIILSIFIAFLATMLVWYYEEYEFKKQKNKALEDQKLNEEKKKCEDVERLKQKEMLLNEELKLSEEYDKFKIEIGVPKNSVLININNQNKSVPSYFKESSGLFYIWFKNEKLYFFSSAISCRKEPYVIHKANIEYFSTQGELYRETSFTGGGGNVISGGGGGSSLGGAIEGAIIGGAVGAIIGSRKEIKETKVELEPITSTTKTHDTRETILMFTDNDISLSLISRGVDVFEIYKKLIPDKEYEIVELIRKNSIMKEKLQYENNELLTFLKEFAKLRDEGIITEDEFIKKKSKLLDL